MKLYSLDYSANYMVGNSDFQAFGMFTGEVKKSFLGGKYPKINKPLKFELHKRAKLTNCLSQGAISSGGLLIDEKVKSVFDSFHIMKHQYYPAEIIGKKGEIINYYWLQLEENLTSEIDFDASIFYELILATKGDKVKISSLTDYEEKKVENGWEWRAKAEQIMLQKDTKLKGYDLFRLFPFDNTLCISKRLKEAIEQHKLTGFEIEEYNKIKFC